MRALVTHTYRTIPHGRPLSWSRQGPSVAFGMSLLISFMSRAANSETLLTSLEGMVKKVIYSALIMAGFMTPPTPYVHQAMTSRPAPAPTRFARLRHAAKVRLAAVPPILSPDTESKPAPVPNSMHLNPEIVLRHYSYTFEGRATEHGQPSANASVLVRLTYGDTSVTKGTVTNADGSYSLSISIDAAADQPVDWMMTARNADSDKVELLGRRIVTHEEESAVTVENSVDFVSDSAPSEDSPS